MRIRRTSAGGTVQICVTSEAGVRVGGYYTSLCLVIAAYTWHWQAGRLALQAVKWHSRGHVCTCSDPVRLQSAEGSISTPHLLQCAQRTHTHT